MLNVKPVVNSSGVTWFMVGEGNLYVKVREQHTNSYFRALDLGVNNELYITVYAITFGHAGYRFNQNYTVYTAYFEKSEPITLYNSAPGSNIGTSIGRGYFYGPT